MSIKIAAIEAELHFLIATAKIVPQQILYGYPNHTRDKFLFPWPTVCHFTVWQEKLQSFPSSVTDLFWGGEWDDACWQARCPVVSDSPSQATLHNSGGTPPAGQDIKLQLNTWGCKSCTCHENNGESPSQKKGFYETLWLMWNYTYISTINMTVGNTCV